MSSKKPSATIKMIIPAGTATAAAPVGPALGQKGVNSKAFCDLFNAQTQNIKKGTLLHVHVFVHDNKTFDIKFCSAQSTSSLIKDVLQLKKGSSKAGLESAGTISLAQLREVAEKKFPDTTTYDIEGAIKVVSGTARSMGLEIQK